MESNNFKWDTKNMVLVTDEMRKIANKLDLDPTIVQVLYQRGYDSELKITTFLAEDQAALHDPFLLHDMKRAIDRIQLAIEQDQLILIYGDYDADGVTSTSIMYETLEQLGANVQYYVPDRFTDGYGPSLERYQQFISEGVKLIVTVDNGVSGMEAISYAKDQQVDVIVTDHHELPAELPPAYAIVHPRYPESEYPFNDLSGAGVAFKVASALIDEPPVEELDLYAIGTIADLVSLTDENRLLVRLGLKQLMQTQRLGLLSLFDVAGINNQSINEQDVGFKIAPRLNAVGRISNAMKAVQLLTTYDEDEAKQLAQEINQTNQTRQRYVQDIMNEVQEIALSPINEEKESLVIWGNNWHQGVLGIVASRIVELTHKPTIILSNQDESTTFKGSGRSVDQLNLFQALESNRDKYLSFGGHHMAIGISVDQTNLDTLSQTLKAACEEQNLDYQQKPFLKIDFKATEAALSTQFIEQLDRLRPFGTGNPEPVVEIDDANIDSVKRIGKNQDHLKIQLKLANTEIDALAFGKGELSSVLNEGSSIKVAGVLAINEWQGKKSSQLMIKDIHLDGLQIVDARANRLSPKMFETNDVYVFFHSKLRDIVQAQFPDKQLKMFNEIMPTESLTIVDGPETMADLQKVLTVGQPQLVTLELYYQNDFYAEGVPDRKQFGMVYKTLVSQNFKASEVSQIAEKTKIHLASVKLILNVFFELGFVKIEDGVIIVRKDVTPHNLEDAPSLQRRQELVEIQKKLLYGNSNELALTLQELMKDTSEGAV